MVSGGASWICLRFNRNSIISHHCSFFLYQNISLLWSCVAQWVKASNPSGATHTLYTLHKSVHCPPNGICVLRLSIHRFVFPHRSVKENWVLKQWAPSGPPQVTKATLCPGSACPPPSPTSRWGPPASSSCPLGKRPPNQVRFWMRTPLSPVSLFISIPPDHPCPCLALIKKGIPLKWSFRLYFCKSTLDVFLKSCQDFFCFSSF